MRSCAPRSSETPQLEIVAINDVFEIEALAHLLTLDSVYGRFAYPVEIEDGALVVDGRRIRVLAERDPGTLPWDELDVDVVIEATGRFRTRAEAARHIEAGARKVILSAPAKGSEPADADLVLGVNFDEVYDQEHHHIVTNASCTTNCLAPVAKVLHETVGIRHGLMTTIHAYTADQHLLDSPHKDLRRARAAAINLIPTSTGAAKALGLVIPELAGKLNGFAVRVPIPTGSLIDLTVEIERETTASEINAAFAGRAATGALAGILAYSEEPIVSRRHRQVAVLGDLRRATDHRHRRHTGQGRRLVRQRVGLRQPTRGAGRADARAGARPGLIAIDHGHSRHRERSSTTSARGPGDLMSAYARTPCIVVGYDGSPPSCAAVQLAVDRVGDGKIFVVCAYDSPGDFWGGEDYQELLGRALNRGGQLLARVALDADPRLAGIDHELELIAGRPAEVIAGVADTRNADEIIVGSRGFGRVRSVLGSVAHELLHEAACPVTVIPERALTQTLDAENGIDRFSFAG